MFFAIRDIIWTFTFLQSEGELVNRDDITGKNEWPNQLSMHSFPANVKIRGG